MELQSGAEADLTIEVRDLGGNIIPAHGQISCISEVKFDKVTQQLISFRFSQVQSVSPPLSLRYSLDRENFRYP